MKRPMSVRIVLDAVVWTDDDQTEASLIERAQSMADAASDGLGAQHAGMDWSVELEARLWDDHRLIVGHSPC